MDVAIPHTLGREEVRKRLREHGHAIGENIPGGIAEIQTSWPSEDRMGLSISAMGQMLTGHIDIEDERVVIDILLPPALGFLKPVINAAIRDQGTRMLAPPKE